MIILQADNRSATINQKYSYLVDNYPSGVNEIGVVSIDGFSVDDFILIGDWGDEDAELFRILSIDSSNNTIRLADKNGASVVTRFPHSESTKITISLYNQIRFFWTAAAGDITDENPTFDTNNPLTSYIDIEPGELFTTYSDSSHSSGFGWFIFYNSVNSQASSESNPIPYSGFSSNTVYQVFYNFDSLLDVKTLKLITDEDKFAWLNEAMSIVQNKLNLNNIEYYVTAEKTLNITAGVSEYLLPDDFGDLVYIHDGTESKTPIPFENVARANLGSDYLGSVRPYNPYSTVGGRMRYYLRNRYIGFVPTPTSDATFKYRYRKKASVVTSISDYIDCPDNAFYALKDYMLYRAYQKFSNPRAGDFLKSFEYSMDLTIQSATKRDGGLDSWMPDPTTIV